MTRDELIDQTIDAILEREQGFVNDPADRGGATKWGITQETLTASRGRAATPADVEALTPEEARAILRASYIERPGFLSIANAALFDAVVDCGVNMGPKRAAMLLQRALGVREDGIFGPATRAALQVLDVGLVYRRFVAERIRRYGRIISNDPRQAKFAAGWLNRAAEFVEQVP